MTTSRLTFRGTALTDLLLVNSARRGNVLASHPFIPGAALRGHLAQRWLRDRADDERFRHLFESGAVRFHTAHPTAGPEPTLPAPLSRRTCKINPFEPGHFSDDTLTLDSAPVCTAHGDPAPNEQATATKRVRGVLAPDGVVIDPGQLMVTRGRIGTVDDATGSGLAAHQALFTERRIGADTAFVFEIDGAAEDLEAIAALLDPDGDVVTVGRARSVLGAVEVGAHELQELPVTPIADDGPITLTFLSDTVLVDVWHRSVVALDDPEVLARLLTMELDHPVAAESIELYGSAVRATTVGGWDGRDRWHKPIEPAIAAGSAIRFTCTDRAALSLLAARSALGWRTAEGFGRIAIDHWTHNVALRGQPSMATDTGRDGRRDRIAQVAAAHARTLADTHAVSRSLWQGIEETVRSGLPLRLPHVDDDRHPQSDSGRSAQAGWEQRRARRKAIEAFNGACSHLKIAPGSTDRIHLADDIGRELDLLTAPEKDR